MAEGDGEEVGWLRAFVDSVRETHDVIIATSGGALGEDTAKLYSACARPFQSAAGKFVYETELEQAAALFHGIICGHVFTDGCKRTAVVWSIAFLLAAGWLTDTSDELIGEMEVVALRTASPPSPSVDHVIAEFSRIFGRAARS